MSRRKGQNPEVRVGERADGKKYYFFPYWIDVRDGKKESVKKKRFVCQSDDAERSGRKETRLHLEDATQLE